MTLEAFSRAIVDAVLTMLDAYTFAAIPETAMRAACTAVADLMRAESAACVEPQEEEPRDDA